MSSVMPAATYPKYYVINEKIFRVTSAAEDTSFQAKPLYNAQIVVAPYPKVLQLGHHQITVLDATSEASARAKFAQG